MLVTVTPTDVPPLELITLTLVKASEVRVAAGVVPFRPSKFTVVRVLVPGKDAAAASAFNAVVPRSLTVTVVAPLTLAVVPPLV